MNTSGPPIGDTSRSGRSIRRRLPFPDSRFGHPSRSTRSPFWIVAVLARPFAI
ncbi:hypothetical protein [Halostagnicola sp. A56]|uniref:hypothetical protein n=1 Tax=Halostagnicola sp. A56 TaxID=1495067 RepID=UPI0012E261A4|nr:hypothetical protein [Halostagnicola sp. A56]